MPQELIEFRGRNYPARCSYCLAPIGNSAVILLNTDLIFCSGDCVIGFIGSRTANINIRGEGRIQCMLS